MCKYKHSLAKTQTSYIVAIFTIYSLGARAVPGNTSPRFFIQPELARAVWKTKGLYFWYGTSTQLVNSLLHDPF